MSSTQPTQPTKIEAVVKAALEWFSERQVRDWSEADLAHAIISMEGDWPGCEGCDFACDEPCTPATEAEQHAAVDAQIAQLVHDGKLLAPDDYAPPEGWTPITIHRKRDLSADLSRLLNAAQTEVAALKALRDELVGAMKRIRQRAASDAPCEELEDAQRDLRHIFAIADAALAKHAGSAS